MCFDKNIWHWHHSSTNFKRTIFYRYPAGLHLTRCVSSAYWAWPFARRHSSQDSKVAEHQQVQGNSFQRAHTHDQHSRRDLSTEVESGLSNKINKKYTYKGKCNQYFTVAHKLYSIVLCRLTVNSFVEEVIEVHNWGQHLFPGEVQQCDHSEAKMLQVVGELMYVHNGSHQLWVIRVIQVADKESDFISG